MEGRFVNLSNLPRTVSLVEEGDSFAFCYVDQRVLPDELKLVQTRDWNEVVSAIKKLAVRGAPAIGLAGVAALALWAQCEGLQGNVSMDEVARTVSSARPTAVNLQWGVERAYGHVKGIYGEKRAQMLLALLQAMIDEDERCNRAMGANGAALLPPNARVLTHCNAGSLAASFYGTALGVVYAAAELNGIARVYADETRPVGQGARLTSWELARVGIPVTLICDNMAASLMASGEVDAVIVGADRIAANGDTANKIGTYGVAVLAHEHGIPFYVVAPTSTIDPTLSDGSLIPIEQRDPAEVLAHPIEGVDVWNPAFDVTPARYITAIITENGVYAPDCLAL